ncbi:MAG: polyprotein (domains: capsid, helicase, peptidase, RdRP) [Plant associated waikavirus 2]|nr:MAG: polyprotein (domains: capsid, helicase, peptidase, RdRP) [Plant associated waikavirus 2]
MQKPHPTLTHSVSPSERKTVFPVSHRNTRFEVILGVHLFSDSRCTHNHLHRRVRDITCSYCNLLDAVYNSYIKSKCVISRSFVASLISVDFDTFYKRSLLLSFKNYSDAEKLTDYRISCQFAGTLPNMFGAGVEISYNHNSRSICNYAQHLFECVSIGEQAGGKLFPVCGESNSWNATCTQCGASCQFSTARSQTLLALFFYFCRARIIDNVASISLKCSEEWVNIDGGSLGLFCRVTGLAASALKQLGKISETDHFVKISDVNGNVEGITYGINAVARFARCEDTLSSSLCKHSFMLSSSAGSKYPLTSDMLRLFMLLLPCNGYLIGEDKDKNIVAQSCGIVSIGGMSGVNAACNYEFLEFHESFYQGPFREPNLKFDEMLTKSSIPICNVEITAEAQMVHYHSELGEIHSSEGEEVVEEEVQEGDGKYAEEEEQATKDHYVDLCERYEAFLQNDDTCFEVEIPRTQGRGLKQRIGSLLRGVSNCVKRLHAVWDWPLDVIVKAADDTGKWMEKHKEHVSDDVWSCRMCTQVNEDQAKEAKIVEKSMEMLRSAIKKLSVTIDDMSSKSHERVKALEKEVEDLKREVAKLGEQERTGSDNNNTLIPAVSKMIAESNIDVKSELNGMKNEINALYDLVDTYKGKAEEVPKRRVPASKLPTTSGVAGETMPIARGLTAKKQSDLKETEIVNPEFESSAEVIQEMVEASGANSVNNAIYAKHLVASFQWQVSSGEGRILADIGMPGAIFQKNARMANFASYFQYYTCEALEFEISTTSIAMQGGTLFIAWDSLSCASRQKIGSVLQLSGLPGVYVHASSSSVTTFRVDNPSLQHMSCLSGSERSLNDLGTLKICCANVLNAPSESSQKVEVHVWVKFVKPTLNFYTIKHDLAYLQAQGGGKMLAELGQLEAIVTMGKWSTTSSTNLCELLVHPTSCSVTKGLVTQTPLSIASHIFSRWRGSLIFKFIFGASAFVKGKLMVTAVPVQFRDKSLTVEEMSGLPSIICDLTGESKEFEFTVPYHSIGNNSLVCRNALFDVSSYDAELVTTRLHVLILDALVMNANASNSIGYVVTMRPGPDFELIGPHGVHGERVSRTLAQVGFQRSLTCGKLLGDGFGELCGRMALLRTFSLDDKKRNVLSCVVSPTYRSLPPCSTLISWLAQIFVQWSGSLIYELRAHSFDKTKANFIRVWYEPNGSTTSGEEFEFLTGVDPPAGALVHYWTPADGPFRIEVPFSARTKKLLIQKPRYDPNGSEWLQCYNGALFIDYEGREKIEIQMSIAGGSDFEMYDRTVAPMVGNVTSAFTKLSYASELLDISATPSFAKTTLRGPLTDAEAEPIKFKPIAEAKEEKAEKKKVKVEPRTLNEFVEDAPKEGERGEDEEGNELVFRRGEWRYVTARKQMDCCLPKLGLGHIQEVSKTLKANDTCQKLAGLVNEAHKSLGESDENASVFPELAESLRLLLPLLRSMTNVSESLKGNIGVFDVAREKVVKLLLPLISKSIPGIVKASWENSEYVWATIVTLVGGAALWWASAKVKGFVKKFSVLCMIIWSPFLAGKVWDFGVWIKNKWFNDEKKDNEGECRKHSIAGLFEGSGEKFCTFTEWFSGNWTSVVQSLLSVLGVVASLVIWGTIPDAKKLSSFSAIFKEVGDKGRSISNICGGFSAINKLVGEWSKRITEWILGSMSSSSPSADSALQQMLKFSLREWVDEVRTFALMENRFTGFGGEEHLTKVRHLYDKSMLVQRALLDGCKVDVQLGLIIRECKDKCTELMNESYTFKGMKKPRIDPLHVCMYGGPGVGKSTLTHVLINDILDHRGEPEVDRIFTRCCADAYWSNYHQEPVILYDDLGAIQSGLKLSDYAEIMGAKTNDPFSVPMAGVNDKGRHCTSKYIFSCTNVLALDDTGDVVTKSAFYRRRNILVEVERDESVARDESDPTKGLLFTVLSHKLSGVDQSCVSFEVKEDWTESFLSEEDTSGWYFYRVNYELFLAFACRYTDLYMASQEKLLKGINRRRETQLDLSSVNFGTMAQVDSKVVTLASLISKFDSLKLPGKEIYHRLANTGIVLPCQWNTKQTLGVREYMQRMCECAMGEQVCGYDISFARLREAAALVSAKERDQENFVGFHSQYTFLKMGPSLDEVKFTLKGDVKAKVNDIELLCNIITYIGWCEPKPPGLCPWKNRDCEVDHDHIDLSDNEVSFDDRLKITATIKRSEHGHVVVWREVGKFFPSIVGEFGSVSIKVGNDYCTFLPEALSASPTKHIIEASWNVLCVKGIRNGFESFDLLNPRDQNIAKILYKEVKDWQSVDGDLNSNSELHAKAVKAFGVDVTLVIFRLAYVCEMARQRKARIAESRQRIRRANFINTCDSFKDYEEKVGLNLSKGAKVGLAIVGGLLCVGSLIGLGFGFKHSIDSIMKLFEKKQCNQDNISGVEVCHVSADEIVTDSAVPEVSSAQESDLFTTSHRRKDRVKPLQRPVTEHSVKHVTSALESDQFRTNHVRGNYIRPVPRLSKQAGFGVTYSESDESRIVKAKRVSYRKDFLNATKQISNGKKGRRLSLLKDIDKWQNGVIKRGISKSLNTEFVSFDTDNVSWLDESFIPEKKHTIAGDDFINEKVVVSFLEKHMSNSRKVIKAVVADGVVGSAHKQVKVGSMGLDRDVNMVSLIETHISRMSCVIYNATQQMQCNVLRLKGTMIVMPAHYAEFFEEDDEIYFVCPNKVVKIRFDTERMVLLHELQDLIVWDLGNNVPPSNDYVKYIATLDDWEHYSDGSGALSMTRYDKKNLMQMVHSLETVERIKANTQVPSGTYKMLDSTHTILMGLRYRMHCMEGFCGAAILRADTKMVRKIIGIHTAGNDTLGVGYAEMLIKEHIVKAMEFLTVDASRLIDGKNLDDSPVVVCDKQCDSIPNCGNLGILGIVDKREIPVVPTRTTICPSLIFGLIGDVKSEPSILSSYDKRLGEKRGVWDPVLDAVTKYGVEISPFPETEITIVEDHLTSVFSNFENSRRVRAVNNLDIGINGIEGTDFWSPIEMSTSSGWPWCKSKPANACGKKWLFKEIEAFVSGRPRYVIEHVGFQESYNKMLAEAKEGVAPCVVTMECPKDERRKLSKIYEKPATRTFTILPPEVNILFRQYFGDFAAMVMSNRHRSFCQVGINPETLEWSELMNSFLAKSDRGFAGDYAKFDGIVPASIYHSIVNVVNKWYDDGTENAMVRHSLLNSIIHRKGIAKDKLVQYSQGMPSGFAMTVIFNSFVNYYFMSLAWINLVGASVWSPQSDLKSFDRYCRIIVYGDDNVVAVDEDFLEIYNLRSVASYLSTFGITYTDDAKNPIHLSEKHVDITSVTFLKRNFTRVSVKGSTSFLWKACLDKISVEERCHWIRECPDPEEALCQNVEGALYEASIWGEEYFNDLRGRLRVAFKEALLSLPEYTYVECQRRWWSSMTGSQPSLLNLDRIVKMAKLNQIDLNASFRDELLKENKTLLSMLKDATPLRHVRIAA